MNNTTSNSTSNDLYSYYIGWVNILLWSIVAIAFTSITVVFIWRNYRHHCCKRYKQGKLIQRSVVTTQIFNKFKSNTHSRVDTPINIPTHSLDYDEEKVGLEEDSVEFDSRSYNNNQDPEIVENKESSI